MIRNSLPRLLYCEDVQEASSYEGDGWPEKGGVTEGCSRKVDVVHGGYQSALGIELADEGMGRATLAGVSDGCRKASIPWRRSNVELDRLY